MKRLLVVCLMLLPSLAAASPLAFAIRGEQVWTQPITIQSCKPSNENWTDDVLLSLAADYKLNDSGLFLIGRFGHRLDADKQEGSVGLEYRFVPYQEESQPLPAKKARARKRPCP